MIPATAFSDGAANPPGTENEAELLLSEMRHRMKNNLQTIQSLLRVSKSRAASPEARQALAEIELHVSAINGVDGQLLPLGAAHSVALGLHLRRLAGDLERAFRDGDDCRFNLAIENMDVDASCARALGLIVNEAVTNSFKHRSPDLLEIDIALCQEGEKIVLSVADNGSGFDIAAQAHRGGTLLIRRMAQKIGAALDCRSGPEGTRYVLRFPASSRSLGNRFGPPS